MTDSLPTGLAPLCDWMFFRSDVLAGDARVASILDMAYCAGARAGRTWFEGKTESNEEDVDSFLTDQISGLEPGEQVARLRGCQAGAFAAGWHMRLNVPVVMGRRGGTESLPVWSQGLKQRLIRQRSPLIPALATVLVTPGMILHEVTNMQCRDLVKTESGWMLRVADQLLVPPEGGSVFLTVYALWRSEVADAPESPLWLGSSLDTLRDGWFRPKLALLAQLTGEPFMAFNRHSVPRRNWSQRRGIHLVRLVG